MNVVREPQPGESDVGEEQRYSNLDRRSRPANEVTTRKLGAEYPALSCGLSRESEELILDLKGLKDTDWMLDHTI